MAYRRSPAELVLGECVGRIGPRTAPSTVINPNRGVVCRDSHERETGGWPRLEKRNDRADPPHSCLL